MARPLIHKYCTACGTALLDGMCPSCDSPGFSAAIPKDAATDPRLFKTSFVLYFALLATFIPLSFDKNLILLEIIVSILDAVLILAVFFRFRSALRSVLSLPRWHWWGVAVLAAAFLIVISAGYFKLIVEYLNVPYFGVRIDDYQNYGLNWWAIIALTCLQPGIFEEVAFRGLIFEGLSLHLSFRESWLLSTFMFALLHLSLWSIPTIFLIGSTLVWLRWKSGSIFPGMLLHASYNFFCIVWEIKYPLNNVI